MNAVVATCGPEREVAPWQPTSLWIERVEEDSLLARRVRSRCGDVPTNVVDDLTSIARPANFSEGKSQLVLQRQRGSFLHHCPAGVTGMVCCNYLVANFASNCPYDCTYCFLQEYIANNPVTKLFTNPQDGLAEIDGVLRAHPERTFRLGTGELADSLALDWLSDLSYELVPFFAERRNAVLELKTKSTCIDNLLKLDPKDRVVVSWSVNAPQIVRQEEHGAPSLEERAAAARRVQAAGYKIGFHFDPLVAHDGWEEGYRQAIDILLRGLDPKRIAWISLGSLRLGPALKQAIRGRKDRGRILTGELVPGADGKERVWRGMRVKMYRKMLQWLREAEAALPLYICMEPAAVWENVFGEAPSDREVAQRLIAAHHEIRPRSSSARPSEASSRADSK